MQFLEMTDWTSALVQFRKADRQKSNVIAEGSLSALIQQILQLLEHESLGTIKDRMKQERACGETRAMTYLMEYLDQLIHFSRLRQATDPRDHIFGLYGVAQILCDLAKMNNPLPAPDYSKSIYTVFTESCKSLIEQSKSLRLLSTVEDDSARNYTDLPSWVPDLTTRSSMSFPSLGDTEIYKASKQQSMTMFYTENLGILGLTGYCVDTLVELGDDDTSLAGHGAHEPYEKTSKMLLNLPGSTYVNGQDYVEVLWRTLIADQAQGQSPAPVAMGSAFRQQLLMHLSTYILFLEGFQSKSAEETVLRIAPIMQLSKTSNIAATLIPSIEEIAARRKVYHTIETVRKAKSPASQAHRDLWDSVLREEQKAAPFTREAATVFTARRIFRTRDNLIGIGPRSIQTGDEIFILPGSNVPFIMRKREDGTHKLVGEAYVHGIMHGEALERCDLKQERLDLV